MHVHDHLSIWSSMVLAVLWPVSVTRAYRVVVHNDGPLLTREVTNTAYSESWVRRATGVG